MKGTMPWYGPSWPLSPISGKQKGQRRKHRKKENKKIWGMAEEFLLVVFVTVLLLFLVSIALCCCVRPFDRLGGFCDYDGGEVEWMGPLARCKRDELALCGRGTI